MITSVRIWLVICSLLIVIMVWIGGYTRLTSSGLSITEWKPITGIIPPLTQNTWEIEKNKYEATPEYYKINFDITMSDFKRIYLIEYFHRLFGRVIAIVFFVPFIYFFIRNKLSKENIISLLFVLLLGCLQGFMGWYMVKSGLIDQPHVSQYRLALHLTIAAIIFMIIWSQATYHTTKIKVSSFTFYFLRMMMITIVLQVFIGGLVAGLKAGLVYNTFPLMDGEIIPNGLFNMTPWWKNFFENTTTVQFIHRTFGILILLMAIILYIAHTNVLSRLIILVTISQVFLGIFTLLYAIPLTIASLHQITAFLLLGALIFVSNKMVKSNIQ